MSKIEWCGIALALALAHAFYVRIVLFPSAYDAQNYVDIARYMGLHGVTSKFPLSDLRTYGYPSLLMLLDGLSGPRMNLVWTVFEFQLASHLTACLLVRRELAPVIPNYYRWAFLATLCNPIVLSYSAETLTESLSISTLLLACAAWLRMYQTCRISPLPMFLGGLFTGMALMLRPANLFGVAAWIAAIVILIAHIRPHPKATLLCLLSTILGSTLALLPQFFINWIHYGSFSPLVVSSLGKYQQLWGVLYIKYATAMPPIQTPSIFYLNPFSAENPADPDSPLSWYIRNPGEGLLTTGLHLFNMIDQDLLFTYSRDLDPWYRIPLGIAVHLSCALAAFGLYRMFSSNGQLSRTPPPAVALLIFILNHMTLHATTAVEMRFGLPLLLVIGPLAGWTIHSFNELTRSKKLLLVVTSSIYTSGALALSSWVRLQAPSISSIS